MEPEPEPEPEPSSSGGDGLGQYPEGVPSLRQRSASSRALVAALRCHLIDDVGISHVKAAERHASQLFDLGYDSPAAFAIIPLDELRDKYAWQPGHVALVKAWRESKGTPAAPAPAADPVAAGLRAPPCATNAGAAQNPFNADREFFTIGAFDSFSAPAAGEAAPGADSLPQKDSGTCTRYALAAAITDNTNARILLSGVLQACSHASFDASGQKVVVAALQQHMDHAAGAHPDAFHDININIEDQKGRWYKVHLSVKANETLNQTAIAGTNTIDPSRVRNTHVISYTTASGGRHCVYLEGCDLATCKWIGLNSWGNYNQRPEISMHSNVAIYDVEVTHIEVLKGSIVKETAGNRKTLTENMLVWPPPSWVCHGLSPETKARWPLLGTAGIASAAPFRPLAFTLKGGDIELAEGGALATGGWRTSPSAVCGDAPMVEGRHFVELTVNAKGWSMAGVVGVGFDPGACFDPSRPSTHHGGVLRPCDPRDWNGHACDHGQGWMFLTSCGPGHRRGGRDHLTHAGCEIDWGEGMEGWQRLGGGCCPGQRVGLLLDLGEGSLAVYLNGERLGLMVEEGIAPPVRWAVDLHLGASARLESQPAP